MTVLYEIILTIVNLTNNHTKTLKKEFELKLNNLSDDELYNNYHLISEKTKMFTLFKEEINEYCLRNEITINNIDIDEFSINSNTENVDVYFEPADGDDPNQISLEPNIKCYVYPKYPELEVPELNGIAYDHHTIVWSWEEDNLAHYLITEAIDVSDEKQKEKIIAQIPIGTNTYTETNLEADTPYTRRLISYNENQTSRPSSPTTIQTATAPIDQSLDQYEIPKNYDYTTNDAEREFIEENLEAFHSGVGDFNDLKVYKQMDADFYQKFKAYIQLKGSSVKREKCYDSVGFNYRVCLEAIETVEEQKGEVTFDVDVFPIETVSIKDYMYASQPVTICMRMTCDVLVSKPLEYTEKVDCPLEEPVWEEIINRIEHVWVQDDPPPTEVTVVLSLDISGSMTDVDGRGRTKNNRRWVIVREAAKGFIDFLSQNAPIPVKFAITLWAHGARTEVYNDAASAKHCLDSVTFGAGDNALCDTFPTKSGGSAWYQNGSSKLDDVQGYCNDWGWKPPKNLTSHYDGLTNAITSGKVQDPIMLFFFTDGFANDPSPGHDCYGQWTWNSSGRWGSKGHWACVVDSINKAYGLLAGRWVYVLFGAHYNTDWDVAVSNVVKTNPSAKAEVIACDTQIYNLH